MSIFKSNESAVLFLAVSTLFILISGIVASKLEMIDVVYFLTSLGFAYKYFKIKAF